MKRFAIITGILSGFLFGIATPFSKLLLADLNSFQLAGLLYLGAALAMLPFVFRQNSQLKLLFQQGARVKTAGIIFFGGFAGPLLLMAGLKTAHAASVSIWLNMELVATAILGVFIFKDGLDRNAWIGVALTIVAGIITSLGEGSSGITSGLLITAACICWGMDNHLTALTDGASPQTVTFVKGLVAGSVNLTIGCLIAGQAMALGNVAPAIIVGIFSYGISIVLYVTSAQNLGATRSQILFSTAPVWGVLLSYLFNHEPFQWVHLISILLLALAVIVSNLYIHNHLHSHIAMEHIHYHQHTDGHHAHSHEGETITDGQWHSHLHTHEPITHQHPHNPDLHHRHGHG
ncbi:MAG TPA: EamA family transporter [Prolixibacteraceae bacterium]|jgi:drug/metabolite transporter (DMT)-like permease